jgi:hypothetical protein
VGSSLWDNIQMPLPTTADTGGVRRAAFVFLFVGVGVGIWIAGRYWIAEYLYVWGVWSHGDATGHLRLWGLSVLWWGRIGKLLEFIAGLAVVLDLLDVNKMREFGERAGDRWQKYSDSFRLIRVFKVHRLSQRIFRSLLGSYEEGTGRGQVIMISYLLAAPQELREPELADGRALAHLQHDLLRLLEKEPWESPRKAWRAVYPTIFEFLSTTLPTESRISSYVMCKWAQWCDTIGDSMFTALFFSPIVLGTLASLVHLPENTWGASVVGALGAVSFLSITILDYLIFHLMSATLAPTAIAARLAAMILARKRPGYPLKWTAFAIFIVGFQFDLVSS